MTDTFSPGLHQMAGSVAPFRWTVARYRRYGFAALRDILETWEERKRFRLRLLEMMRSTPHLIHDIGLSREEAMTEIAKPIWRE